jgi:hypothetical protein
MLLRRCLIQPDGLDQKVKFCKWLTFTKAVIAFVRRHHFTKVELYPFILTHTQIGQSRSILAPALFIGGIPFNHGQQAQHPAQPSVSANDQAGY